MRKKITVEHKKELMRTVMEGSKSDEEIIDMFLKKHRIDVSKELIERTRELSEQLKKRH